MKLITKISTHSLAIGFIAVGLSCSKQKAADAISASANVESNTIDLTEGQYHAAGIKLESMQPRNISGVLKANGKLDVPPQNMVSISAPFGGFLQATEMLQGMQLRKGQRMAVIQNPDYIQLQQDYLDNKSQLTFLEAEFHRQEELSKENVNAQKSLQQAKAAYFSKLAVVNGLHAKLKMLNIDFASLALGTISSTISLYAPISGFVTEVNFNVGSFVNPTDILFKIVDTSHLHAELTVFEKDVAKVAKGQRIRFTLAGSGKEHLATVYLIGREILPDRTVRIHGHLTVEDKDLLPGMYLSAYIELDNRVVSTLPERAIVGFEGKAYVFVAGTPGAAGAATRHTFTQVEVETGLHENGYVEVNFPQHVNPANSQFVVEGAYSLLSKLKNSEE